MIFLFQLKSLIESKYPRFKINMKAIFRETATLDVCNRMFLPMAAVFVTGMAKGLTCHECNATFHDPQNYAAHLALHSSSLLSLSLARSAAVAAAAAAASAVGPGAGAGGVDAAHNPNDCGEAGRSDECRESVSHTALTSRQLGRDCAERGGAEGGRPIQGALIEILAFLSLR